MSDHPPSAQNSSEGDQSVNRRRSGSVVGVLRALRGHVGLVTAFLAVLVPLVIILVVQYRWLVELQSKSSVYRRASLQKYLEWVDKEISYFYTTNAERALNISPSMMRPEYLRKIAYIFKKSKVESHATLFVVLFEKHEPTIYFYDPKKTEMVPPEFSTQLVAVLAATAPWELLAAKGSAVEAPSLVVDERDHDHRVILKPITDEKDLMIGLTGMIVNCCFMEEELLPKIREMVLVKTAKEGELDIFAWDGQGRAMKGKKPYGIKEDQLVTHHPSFIFKDWKIAIADRRTTPEAWARKNFTFNMTLSLALAVVLIAGIGLVLKVAAREMRLSTMKSDFVSNVSHELRTPLASIRVFAEFMRLGRVKDPEKVREYGEYIETESRRLTQLVNNILDFSRIESGRKVYTFTSGEIEPVVAESVSTFAVRVRTAGFDITLNTPSDPLPLVCIDASAIDQAICNLLDNAVKYSGESRAVEVNVRGSGDTIEIAITDHGIGIPDDEQKRIFDRFHRVSTGLVHEVRGSGLGLAIVKHIVEAHQGSISVESEVGKGSTFIIHLPVASTLPCNGLEDKDE